MSWTVTVVPARPHLREKGLYLRARRRVRGRQVEMRSAVGSGDPARAEQGRLVWLGVLNQPDALGIVGAMDARIRDMAADPLKSPESVEAFQVARKKLADAIGDLKTLDRPTLLRAREARAWARAGGAAELLEGLDDLAPEVDGEGVRAEERRA